MCGASACAGGLLDAWTPTSAHVGGLRLVRWLRLLTHLHAREHVGEVAGRGLILAPKRETVRRAVHVPLYRPETSIQLNRLVFVHVLQLI